MASEEAFERPGSLPLPSTEDFLQPPEIQRVFIYMNTSSFLKVLPVALLATAFTATASIDRTIDKSFSTAPGVKVLVDVGGASISAKVGEAGKVGLRVEQTFDASSEAEADEILSKYDITVSQEGDTIKFVSKTRKSGWSWSNLGGRELKQKVFVTVPADANLDLDTSGGSIHVDGETSGKLRADTSGGSITVGGGTGDLNLDTSGGSITVGRALGKLRADTSGGSIRIAYVGPEVSDVNCDTSGGSITIGVDPKGAFDLNADTSGGRVRVEGLPFEATAQSRTHARGKINGGGARLRADTSGGNITIETAKG